MATLYCGKDRKRLSSTTYSRDEIQNMSIKKFFSYIYKVSEFIQELNEKGGTAEFIFWNLQYRVIKVIEAKS